MNKPKRINLNELFWRLVYEGTYQASGLEKFPSKCGYTTEYMCFALIHVYCIENEITREEYLYAKYQLRKFVSNYSSEVGSLSRALAIYFEDRLCNFNRAEYDFGSLTTKIYKNWYRRHKIIEKELAKLIDIEESSYE